MPENIMQFCWISPGSAETGSWYTGAVKCQWLQTSNGPLQTRDLTASRTYLYDGSAKGLHEFVIFSIVKGLAVRSVTQMGRLRDNRCNLQGMNSSQQSLGVEVFIGNNSKCHSHTCYETRLQYRMARKDQCRRPIWWNSKLCSIQVI